MKVSIMSDTHGQMVWPNACDIVIHCGDATMLGRIDEVTRFASWFGDLPAKYKIFVPGNHDWLFQKDPGTALKIMKDRKIITLIDDVAGVMDLNIYGMPWTIPFMDWAFMGGEVTMREKLDKMKATDRECGGIDIVVTHGPARGTADLVGNSQTSMGCPYLAHAIRTIRPRLHCHGHNHAKHGIYVQPNGQVVVNAAIMDDHYKVAAPYITLEM